jgi:hypothetical protein
MALSIYPNTKARAFRPGMVAEVSFDFGCSALTVPEGTATRGGKMTGTPQHTLPITTFGIGGLFSQQAARYSFKAIHQFRNRYLRRIGYEQMDVVNLSVHLFQSGLQVLADRRKCSHEQRQHLSIKNPFPIFCGKDQMHMKLKKRNVCRNVFRLTCP